MKKSFIFGLLTCLFLVFTGFSNDEVSGLSEEDAVIKDDNYSYETAPDIYDED